MADLTELAGRVLDATNGAQIVAAFDEAHALGHPLDALPAAVVRLRDERALRRSMLALADRFDPPAEDCPQANVSSGDAS